MAPARQPDDPGKDRVNNALSLCLGTPAAAIVVALDGPHWWLFAPADDELASSGHAFVKRQDPFARPDDVPCSRCRLSEYSQSPG
jgi:hypothetical protein